MNKALNPLKNYYLVLLLIKYYDIPWSERASPQGHYTSCISQFFSISTACVLSVQLITSETSIYIIVSCVII